MTKGIEQRGKSPFTDSSANRRSKAKDTVTKETVTLMPRARFISTIDIGGLVNGLVDGQYRIQMQ